MSAMAPVAGGARANAGGGSLHGPRGAGGAEPAGQAIRLPAGDVVLRPIDKASSECALVLLDRGFPRKPRSFWAAGFQRLRATRRSNCWPCGYLLQEAGRDVGVILTFASERVAADGRTQPIVNLSSWYVDETRRWLAAPMLKSLVADEEAIFTDLSATPSVARINAALGFEPWHDGLSAVLLPQARWSARRGGRVWPLDQVPSGALAAQERQILEDHARMGCLVGALAAENGWHPLIFVRGRRYGVPIARLIYAGDRRVALDHLGAVAGYLLGHGLLLLLIDGSADERLPGKLLHRPRVTQFKGPMDRSSIDFAYSELAYLGLLT